MSEISERAVAIDFYSVVPTYPGIDVIRLPRCGRCFDEMHDYSFGKAYCIPTDLEVHRQQREYTPMDAETRERWAQAEHDEQERREKESADV